MIVRVILRSLLSVALVGTCATAGEIPSSYFTMTTHDAVKGKQWPTVPIGSIRLWDTFTLWSDLNPSPGVYNWTMLDKWLSLDRKSTRLNSSHGYISYAVFCLKKKKKKNAH